MSPVIILSSAIISVASILLHLIGVIENPEAD